MSVNQIQELTPKVFEQLKELESLDQFITALAGFSFLLLALQVEGMKRGLKLSGLEMVSGIFTPIDSDIIDSTPIEDTVYLLARHGDFRSIVDCVDVLSEIEEQMISMCEGLLNE